MTTVLIVDDQQLLRRGLRLLLETVSGVEVVGEAADGREALAVVAATGPQVVLCDARMPVMDGVAFVAEAARSYPKMPVIVLTTFDDETLVQQALAAGAAGFLLKDSSPEALADAIHAAAQGGLVVDPRVARAALTARNTGRSTAATAAQDPLAVLTATERLVAEQVARGATNAEIAAVLVLAEGTVKNHVSALLRKLGARDRTALALLIYEALHQG
ncbi:DNA-binding NarL/FixJ family response regulator [Kineosphaera limosa]|uniref:Putative two-component response regulator n=1 Tax=Kineosphaera limosa NBRC 100340 TaxID=1184609 RepID=K6VJL5_9MICO|nr:response regulator transcription factor [Kineosphaera limosa]NYE00796.1 DNA-binding NarL/FixJ family response regulator [Kineosphaera limosa]GAB96408.1 putative two-component response regulator [Kineosphaera limosa NBRC 100340]